VTSSSSITRMRGIRKSRRPAGFGVQHNETASRSSEYFDGSNTKSVFRRDAEPDGRSARAVASKSKNRLHAPGRRFSESSLFVGKSVIDGYTRRGPHSAGFHLHKAYSLDR